jgi:hypothetical protein
VTTISMVCTIHSPSPVTGSGYAADGVEGKSQARLDSLTLSPSPT